MVSPCEHYIQEKVDSRAAIYPMYSEVFHFKKRPQKDKRRVYVKSVKEFVFLLIHHKCHRHCFHFQPKSLGSKVWSIPEWTIQTSSWSLHQMSHNRVWSTGMSSEGNCLLHGLFIFIIFFSILITLGSTS